MTEKSGNSPWQEMYEHMGQQCPKNDVERQVLTKLGHGESIPDCLEYWRAMGMDEDGFLQLMRRVDESETEELRRRNRRSG